MNRQKKELLFFLVRIATAGILLSLVLSFLITPRIVRGNQMYPSLCDGQLVLVFRPGKLSLNSLVLYRNPKGEERIGRVVAEEQDVVEIQEDAEILVNENLLVRRIPYPVPAGDLSYPYSVPEKSFFLLNDYRENVEDSRSFGAVSGRDIVGVVVFALKYRDF